MCKRLQRLSKHGKHHNLIIAANADQGERIAQLKTTNDELTLRLSEVIKENKVLRTAIKQAISASSTSTRIVADCDPLDF